jgi:hypothetical protein
MLDVLACVSEEDVSLDVFHDPNFGLLEILVLQHGRHRDKEPAGTT